MSLGTDLVALRDATCVDVPALAEHEQELFGHEAWTEASWWAEMAQRPRRDYVVLDDGGRLAGYAGIDVAGETADVMTIAVLPAYRGRGYGALLLTELERRAAAGGAVSLLLEVRADNAAAIGLYEKAGFARIDVRRRYYQPGDVDALVLRKALSA